MATTSGTPNTATRQGGQGRPVAVTTNAPHDGGQSYSAVATAVHETARVLEAVRDELPRHSWPVVVGATGLVLTGIVDVPAAVGLTALYLAARHWPFPHPQAAGSAR